MKSWRDQATLWIEDPLLKTVVIGAYGFVWHESEKVLIAQFSVREKALLAAYRQYAHWDEVRTYPQSRATKSAIIRFVRTGLLP